MQQYLLMGRDRHTVMRAHVILVQKCMTRQGFDVKVPPPVPPSGPEVDLTARRYGLGGMAEAKEFGYRYPYDKTPAYREHELKAEEFDKSLTAAQREAFLGKFPVVGATQRNGCLGEADKELNRNTKTVHMSGLVPPPIIRAVKNDPRGIESSATRKAIAEFVKCMADKGYPGMTDPRGDPPPGIGTTPEVTPAEVAAATKHVECQESSGSVRVMKATETAFQLKAIEANPEAFGQVKLDLADLVRHATTVVANG